MNKLIRLTLGSGLLFLSGLAMALPSSNPMTNPLIKPFNLDNPAASSTPATKATPAKKVTKKQTKKVRFTRINQNDRRHHHGRHHHRRIIRGNGSPCQPGMPCYHPELEPVYVVGL
jgi:hypothetical protein